MKPAGTPMTTARYRLRHVPSARLDNTVIALLCSLGNAYEAIYVRPDSLMSIVDWPCAVVGLLAFLGLSLTALSDWFYKSDE